MTCGWNWRVEAAVPLFMTRKALHEGIRRFTHEMRLNLAVGGCSQVIHGSQKDPGSDPRDDAYIPQIAVVKKRFPSLATLRAKKASVAPEHALRAEHLGHADDGCHPHIFFGPSKQKHEVERAANASGLEQQVPPVPSQSVHLAGAAVLGLRKLARGANDVSAHLQTIHSIPHRMMQTTLSDVNVSKAVKAPLAPAPPSATSRPTATGNGKRPIPSSMQVLMVPVTC